MLKYNLKLQFIAVLLFTTVSASAEEPVDSLGALYNDLDEFVITAKKEIVKSDGSQLTYDLEQDDTSKGQTLLDALRKVPMITIDGDDNIYINGNSNIRIYVNGKEEPMLTSNYQRIFKAMPAEAVSKIEVITEPGAKYDAEGTGGILNLVTERKQTKDGYAGNASLSGSSQQLSASLYGRIKYGKVTADAGVDFSDNSLQKGHTIMEQQTTDYTSDVNHFMKMVMDQYVKYNYTGGRLSMSWEPTDKDLLSFGVNVTNVNGKILKINPVVSMFNKTGDLQWQTRQSGTGSMVNFGSSGNISYRRLIGESGQAITGAYRFNFDKGDLNLDYENSVDQGDYPITPHERTGSISYEREHTATLDYENPLADGKHRIEAGLKGIFRRNSSAESRWLGLTPETMIDIYSKESGISQLQDVYAAYASYKGTYGNVSANAGVRYEHTVMGVDFRNDPSRNFRQQLNDVTPNASVTYMFGPAENLRLAYQMRITRPSISQLNPMPTYLAQTFAQIGNPDLTSEHTNSISLSYTNFTPKLGGTVTLRYSQTGNAIAGYYFYENGVGYQTYGNFGNNRRTELSGFLTWNINSLMSLSLNGSVDYTDINAKKENLSNHGWNGSYGVNWNYTGPWNMKYTIYGGQMTGAVRLQGNFSGWYYYGLSIKKSFLRDDALTVTLNAGNFLTKYTYWSSTSHTANQDMRSCGANRMWNAGISISWKFGHLQDQVKKTNADIENDDTSTTKSNGIGL